jgi:hypothetical protein
VATASSVPHLFIFDAIFPLDALLSFVFVDVDVYVLDAPGILLSSV